MSKRDDAAEREWLMFAEAMDPVARRILAARDPWSAYEEANDGYGVLFHDLEIPHFGGLYTAWAELADLFEVGSTDLDAAHQILRSAAEKWLDRPNKRSGPWVEQWVEQTRDAVDSTFRA